MSTSIPTLSAPPGEPSTPYHIPCYSGELWTIPTSNSTMRLLVTGSETNNAFAVVGTGGTFDNPIGFHYHNEAHDVFLCLKGSITVWANDKARSLGPGDFASVPPTTIHAYQITSSHTEFVGLIIPGGWEAFFRFIGEPFPPPSSSSANSDSPSSISAPLFPTHDTRNPMQVLIPKLIAASEKFDMIPVRDGRQHFAPQTWNDNDADNSDTKLPGVCAPGGYFLRADRGPKYLVGGTVVRPLATRAESGGKFSVFCVEGAAAYAGRGIERIVMRFKETHHAVQVIDGIVEVAIEADKAGEGERRVSVGAAETVFVPAGRAWRMEAISIWAKWYVFANGGGIGEVMIGVGLEYQWAVVPQVGDVGDLDKAKLEGLQKELDFVVL